MTNQVIEVIVLPNGETKLETRGFVGSSCKQASQFLEQALGMRVQEQPTAEFYQTTATEQLLRQGETR
jgi:hypothetical protein